MTASPAPRVALVDPSAYTPAYDHALARALARAGAQVDLWTSRFAYGEVPAPDGYARQDLFYRRARGAAGSRRRRAAKLVSHAGDMRRLAALSARSADVVHLQWLAVPWLDASRLPGAPLVLTAHDLLPREPRPGQVWLQRRLMARMDAIVVHSEYGRGRLVEGLRLPAERVHVIHHGAFDHVAAAASAPGPGAALPAELQDTGEPVVLFFGLLRPYKGLDTLLAAWRGITGAQLWIVGRPMLDLAPLRARAPAGVQLVTRYVSEPEVAALFARAGLVVLPYARTERFDQSGVLATALACGLPSVISDIGGFPEVAATGAARLVPAGDADALHDALADARRRPRAARADRRGRPRRGRRPLLVGDRRRRHARALRAAARRSLKTRRFAHPRRAAAAIARSVSLNRPDRTRLARRRRQCAVFAHPPVSGGAPRAITSIAPRCTASRSPSGPRRACSSTPMRGTPASWGRSPAATPLRPPPPPRRRAPTRRRSP